MMNKHRQEVHAAISDMLDNPNKVGIYPTTKCYDRIVAYCDHQQATIDRLEKENDRLERAWLTLHKRYTKLEVDKGYRRPPEGEQE